MATIVGFYLIYTHGTCSIGVVAAL